MAEVFVLGVGMTAFGKRSETLPELMAEAAEAALKRSGRETLDAMYVGVMNPEEFSGESNIAAAITDYLGLWGSARHPGGDGFRHRCRGASRRLLCGCLRISALCAGAGGGENDPPEHVADDAHPRPGYRAL